MKRHLFVAALLLQSCASGQRTASPPPIVEDPAAHQEALAPALAGYSAHFAIYFRGERIGKAHEELVPVGDHYAFRRTEEIRVKRSGELAVTQTKIDITVDTNLVARKVSAVRIVGGVRSEARAERLFDESWSVTVAGGAERSVSGEAVPYALVPILVATRGSTSGEVFSGQVMMEGMNMAIAKLRVERGQSGVVWANLASKGGKVRARAVVDERGFIVRAGEKDGVMSRRVSEDEYAAEFAAAEIMDTVAVPVDGTVSESGARFVVHDVEAAPPALSEVPGQVVARGPNGRWIVKVSGGDSAPPILTSAVQQVSRALRDDLGSYGLGPEEVIAAGAGDCTAHALVLLRYLQDRNISAKLVTGFVFQGNRFRRHRWVTARVQGQWIPVDPMFGQSPADGRHFALAVHGGQPDELALVDEVVFAGWDKARAEVVR